MKQEKRVAFWAVFILLLTYIAGALIESNLTFTQWQPVTSHTLGGAVVVGMFIAIIKIK